MKTLSHLLERNSEWTRRVLANDPAFFSRLSKQQNPEYLWIGCSDSRVPANQIIDLPPGQVFVHRNIANVVAHTDLNCLSVVHYAVEVLKVKHIIVCGHYGCGGVEAAMEEEDHGMIDSWLGYIRDVSRFHEQELDNAPPAERYDLLCELNVKEQMANVCNTSTVQKAWEGGSDLTVHGWIYDIKNGILKRLSTRNASGSIAGESS